MDIIKTSSNGLDHISVIIISECILMIASRYGKLALYMKNQSDSRMKKIHSPDNQFSGLYYGLSKTSRYIVYPLVYS
jgi:hypothetical protein